MASDICWPSRSPTPWSSTSSSCEYGASSTSATNSSSACGGVRGGGADRDDHRHDDGRIVTDARLGLLKGSGAGYRGVRKRSWGKWVAEIRMPRSRERIWLGSYASAGQAARAYDAAVLCLRGRAASLNLPHLPPPTPPLLPLSKKDVQSIAAAAASALPPSPSPHPSSSPPSSSTISSSSASSFSHPAPPSQYLLSASTAVQASSSFSCPNSHPRALPIEPPQSAPATSPPSAGQQQPELVIDDLFFRDMDSNIESCASLLQQLPVLHMAHHHSLD